MYSNINIKKIQNITENKYIRELLIALSVIISGILFIHSDTIVGYILFIILGGITIWNRQSSILKEHIEELDKTELIKEVEEETGVTFDKIYRYNNGFASVRNMLSTTLFISDIYQDLPDYEKKFVLYHEASHVKTRDSHKEIILFIISVITIISLIYFNLYILAFIITCVYVIGLNKYSQNNEYKCDLYAINNIDHNPEDIDTMDLFTSRQSDKYSIVTKYLRTHPYNEERKQYIKENSDTQ